MEVTDWIAIFGAIGIGSSLTVLIQWLLARSDQSQNRRIEERKEAYVGLWVARHRSETENTEAAALNVGHWVARCELVAPENATLGTQSLVDTRPGIPERSTTVRNPLNVMRADLGIAT
jgi:hypothetical protein